MLHPRLVSSRYFFKSHYSVFTDYALRITETNPILIVNRKEQFISISLGENRLTFFLFHGIILPTSTQPRFFPPPAVAVVKGVWERGRQRIGVMKKKGRFYALRREEPMTMRNIKIRRILFLEKIVAAGDWDDV